MVAGRTAAAVAKRCSRAAVRQAGELVARLGDLPDPAVVALLAVLWDEWRWRGKL